LAPFFLIQGWGWDWTLRAIPLRGEGCIAACLDSFAILGLICGFSRQIGWRAASGGAWPFDRRTRTGTGEGLTREPRKTTFGHPFRFRQKDRDDMVEKAKKRSARHPLCLAFAWLGLTFAAAAHAHDYTAGNLSIGHPWARASVTSNGAVYFTIANNGQEADRLIAVSTPMAKSAEPHTDQMENGVMHMVPLAAVEIAPGEPTVFQPGGNHVMLIGLAHPLKKGERFPMTLTFDHAGQVNVEVVVESAGAMAPTGQMPQGQMPQGQMPMGSGGMGGMQHGVQPSQ
jgi:periplasmic copper chaperone A